jgi:hypothetical protein
MKYVLVITFCSFLTQECPIQFYDDTIYQDWSSCMKAGIEKSSGLIDGMDKEVVNQMKIAPKFICYEQKAESV